MADWKKVIVAESNADLNHISASYDVSASGGWSALVEEADNQEILVIYDPATGQFKKRALNTFPGAPGYTP